VEALRAPVCDKLATARFTPSRGIGTPRGHASSPAGQRGAFLSMHQEGTMTARRPAKPSPARALTRKQDPEPPTNRWDVIRYAIDDNGRTIRLCLIILVAGVVLAALLILRFWV